MTTVFEAMRDGNGPVAPLPPGQPSEFDTRKALVNNDRSFLVGERLRSVDPERMVPCEVVLPGVYVPYLMVPNIGGGGRWDLDHCRFQVNDPRLVGPDKRPLRYCYAQLLPRATHVVKNEAFDAVLIPEVPDAIFQAVLLGAAKYFPSYAVDLSRRKPSIVRVDETMRDRAHQEGWVRMQPYTAWKTGSYLAQYVLTNGMDAIRDSVEVAQFLEARDERARRFASFRVVRKALQVVVDPIEPTYEVARRRGRIRRPEATAARFVSLFFERHQPDYIPTIAQSLQIAQGQYL